MTNSSNEKVKRKYVPNCDCDDVEEYIKCVLKKKIKTSKQVYQACALIKKEFKKGKIEVNRDLYDKYIKIGYLFFPEIFQWQKFATAICLCTFYKGTKRARWNKVLFEIGRGNGKDGMIAWWSVCLTSKYHGVRFYDVDIIANSMTQSLRPVIDIENMIADKRKQKLLKRTGDSIYSYATGSYINARSSDADVQDGLRSGAVIFNEIHAFKNYDRMDVMISGLGKIDDPRTFYFTTNGKVRGGPLDDMLDTSNDILSGIADDNRMLYLIYKIDEKQEAYDKKNWVKANPSLPYRQTLMDEMLDEFEKWKKNPAQFPAFLQKRMNLPEMPTDQEVVPWETVLKTQQRYDLNLLKGKSCVVGIDLSKTTDWTAINFLFFDDETEKYICVNHAFICGKNKDLSGIKAPITEWCKKGFCEIINDKEVDPEMVIKYIFDLATVNEWAVEHIAFDDYKKGLLQDILKKYGFSKENGNISLIRLQDVARNVAVIERTFVNEKFVWFDNRMLCWSTNNAKVIPWQYKKTLGDNDIGNQVYGKINERFRKTDPFMAMVHSFIKRDVIDEISDMNDRLNFVGF